MSQVVIGSKKAKRSNNNHPVIEELGCRFKLLLSEYRRSDDLGNPEFPKEAIVCLFVLAVRASRLCAWLNALSASGSERHVVRKQGLKGPQNWVMTEGAPGAYMHR